MQPQEARTAPDTAVTPRWSPKQTRYGQAFKATLTAEGLDASLRAYSLSLPEFAILEQEMDVIDADAIVAALKFARKSLASEHAEALRARFAKAVSALRWPLAEPRLI